jgi:anti-sigma factor RsiW
MSHIDDRLTAFVDGELDHGARDRVLAHLTDCADCRAEAEAQRRSKQLLAMLPAPPVPDALTQALLALAEPGDPLPPRRGSMPGVAVAATLPPPGHPTGRRQPDGGPRASARRPQPGRRRAVRAVAVTGGLFSLTGLAFGAAFLLGAPDQEPGVPLQPPVTNFSVQHAVTSNGMPLNDPAANIVQTSFMSGTSSGPSYGGFGTISVTGTSGR